MNVNKHIVVGTVIIVAGGLIKKWQQPSGSVTPVLLGGFVLMTVLGVLDLAGGGASKLAGGIAMLAAVTVILTEFPWSSIFKFVGAKTA